MILSAHIRTEDQIVNSALPHLIQTLNGRDISQIMKTIFMILRWTVALTHSFKYPTKRRTKRKKKFRRMNNSHSFTFATAKKTKGFASSIGATLTSTLSTD